MAGNKKDLVKELKRVHSIQGRTGNWDYDPYMHGLFNGLELALAIAEDREPKYKDAPARWVGNNPKINKPRNPIA